jgi:predicted Zn-dependent protease with MMP-like domain
MRNSPAESLPTAGHHDQTPSGTSPGASVLPGTLLGVNIDEFEREVETVLAALPGWVQDRMDNVYVVVERRPTREQDPSGDGLLGIYEGVSLDERGVDYFGVAPDQIVIFYEPHMALGLSGTALRTEIRTTVLHELGHHLGMTDERLHELGWA